MRLLRRGGSACEGVRACVCDIDAVKPVNRVVCVVSNIRGWSADDCQRAGKVHSQSVSQSVCNYDYAHARSSVDNLLVFHSVLVVGR